MAITKPAVLPVWAESGDKVQPTNSEIQTGWPFSNVPPARQRFNWLENYLMNGIRYFSRRGLPDWDSAETYMTGDVTIGDNGSIYRSKIDNNLNHVPSTSPSQWELSLSSLADMAGNLQKQTYTAFTTGGTSPNFTLTPSPAITSYQAGQRFRIKIHAGTTSWVAKTLNVSGLGAKDLKVYSDDGQLLDRGAPTGALMDVEYDGVRFLYTPNQLRVAGAAEILAAAGNLYMSPQNFAGNSLLTGGGPWFYQFPGGFTINFGQIAGVDDQYIAVTFAKPFNTVLTAYASPIRNAATTGPEATAAHVGNVTTNGLSVGLSSDNASPSGAYWFAFGIAS